MNTSTFNLNILRSAIDCTTMILKTQSKLYILEEKHYKQKSKMEKMITRDELRDIMRSLNTKIEARQRALLEIPEDDSARNPLLMDMYSLQLKLYKYMEMDNNWNDLIRLEEEYILRSLEAQMFTANELIEAIQKRQEAIIRNSGNVN